MENKVLISIVIGSESDRGFVEKSGIVDFFKGNILYECRVLSAHRHSIEMREFCDHFEGKVIIAVAGMAAHLPGAIKSHLIEIGKTGVTVIGVPLPSPEFPNAMDALLSMVRMPSGIPVLVSGIGISGLKNAAYAAAEIIASSDEKIQLILKNRYHIAALDKPAKLLDL